MDSSFNLDNKAIRWESNLSYLGQNLAKLSGSDSIWSGKITLDSNNLPHPKTTIEETFDTQIQFPFKYRRENRSLALIVIGNIGSFVESSPRSLYWNKNNSDKDIILTLDAVEKTKITVKNISCEDERYLSYKIIDNETSYPKIIVTQKYNDNNDIFRTELKIQVSCEPNSNYTLIVPVLII